MLKVKIQWCDLDPIEPSALPEGAGMKIAIALKTATDPLIITGYCGRNHSTVGALVRLANLVPSLRVLDTGGSDMNFPADHPAWLSVRYGVHESILKADVILVLDCDVPWIPTQCKPSKTAIIFHIDVDTLKSQMPLFYIPAIARYKADSFTSVSQIVKAAEEDADSLNMEAKEALLRNRENDYASHLAALSDIYVPNEDGSFGTGHLCKTLRKLLPVDAIFAVEAVTVSSLLNLKSYDTILSHLLQPIKQFTDVLP